MAARRPKGQEVGPSDFLSVARALEEAADRQKPVEQIRFKELSLETKREAPMLLSSQRVEYKYLHFGTH